MGSITAGIGLISGINSASLIEQLIAVESRGKTRLQSRISNLQAQRTALLDINSRLLNFKGVARSFRFDNIFTSTRASSSSEETLTASAGSSAQLGTYQFRVSQLVSTSSMMTRGFVDRDSTPLGLSSLSFEFGQGRLVQDRRLDALNGGVGVKRGEIQITDKSGAMATIDLTDVVTLSEVIDRINSTSAIRVTAEAVGDHLVISDTSGGGGSLTIGNVGSDTTATDLGIEGTTADSQIVGSSIFTLAGATAVGSINDGLGLLVRNNVPDLRITARDGSTFEIDLGIINADIETTTLLADLNNGDGVRFNSDPDEADIRFVARDGTEFDVDLTGITTVGGLINRVSSATSGHITLSITDGNKLTVTDTVGGGGNLRVLGAGSGETQTAQDLGLLNETGVAADSFDGAIIPSTVNSPAVQTIQQVIDRINNSETTGGVANEGRITASIAADGVSLQLADTTGGAGNLIVNTTAGNPHAAQQLGLYTGADGVAESTIAGQRLIAGLDDVLVKSLSGGAGLNGATSITISDRNDNSFTLNDIDTYHTLDQLVNAINAAAQSNGVAVTIGLNDTQTGLAVTDSSGGAGMLTISGDAADALGIAAEVAEDRTSGSNLERQYVGFATRLSDLNFGRGVGTGTIRITDGFGATATVSINANQTVFDVLQNINSRGLAVQARINDNGDGLIIEEDLTDFAGTPTVRMKIANVSGTAGTDLRLVGEAASVSGGFIDGSYQISINVSEGDTLNQIRDKINASGAPLAATIVNAGGGATPFRLSLTSAIAGEDGRLIIDSGGFDLGLTTLSEGRDARVFFGSADPREAFIITSSKNSLENIIDGVTINLHKASDELVTLNVERDNERIVDTVNQLVTTFNDAIGRINQYDFFDVESEERGVLLGSRTTSRIRDALYRTLRTPALGVTTSFRLIEQVGVKVNSKGELEFDQAKFTQLLESDPESMRNLFAAFEEASSTTSEIAPGITVNESSSTAIKRGIGGMFDQLLDELTNSVDGTMKLADDSLDSQFTLSQRRIVLFDQRLADRRTKLERQFANLELSLARLQDQSSALQSLQMNMLSFAQRNR